MITKFEDNIFLERPHPTGGGFQKVYKFDNGYGGSLVQFSIGSFGGSYGVERGLYELAVVEFDEDGDYFLTYNTPITDDVLGYLTEDDVNENLLKIKELPREASND